MVRATLMEVICIEENRSRGGHFHRGHFHGVQGDKIKTGEMQPMRNRYIYGTKKGKREVTPREKGEAPKERLNKMFASAKNY